MTNSCSECNKVKKPILLHNPHDINSWNFLEYMKNSGEDFCLLTWYNPVDEKDPRGKLEAERLIYMVLNGILDGGQEIPPPVDYSDEDFDNGKYPTEYQRWNMTCCEEHSKNPYIGPPPRSFPSLVRYLPDGSLGLWDLLIERDRGEVETITPEEMYLNSLNPEKMVCSVQPGEVLAGQWAATCETHLCKYFSNYIIQRAVKNYIKKYCTIEIKNIIDTSLPELVEVDKKDKILLSKELEL